jgi:hypothetical protein
LVAWNLASHATNQKPQQLLTLQVFALGFGLLELDAEVAPEGACA